MSNQVNPSSPALAQEPSSDVAEVTDRLGEVGDLTVPEKYWGVSHST